MTSLSARRAWIEMYCLLKKSLYSPVALRKESVDRNALRLLRHNCSQKSLSARRAWIEILDRGQAAAGFLRRSPQGERG